MKRPFGSRYCLQCHPPTQAILDAAEATMDLLADVEDALGAGEQSADAGLA
ncbi:hypothetical protein [Rhodopirellula sp. SWK7]|uniref:hypothetical protein n=1 Tax=Rhodopirellula sp. SWK7 TaxID=595460 RepID=UPI0002BEDA27|nr:hypothetical protein [Rhodopirellula sp. SWK7]EMI46079.1 hypothetical protein RRSWK_01433 [Rhodopirellula sp. SWK7]